MSHITYVEHIVPGMPIFLFNYADRKMHGIFEAASDGALNISHYAWTGGTDGARTQFPAQVCYLSSLPLRHHTEINDNFSFCRHWFARLG